MKKLLLTAFFLIVSGLAAHGAVRPEWSQTTASSTTKVIAGEMNLTDSLAVYPSSCVYTQKIKLDGKTGDITAKGVSVSTMTASSGTITNLSATNVSVSNDLSVTNNLQASYLLGQAGTSGIDMRGDPWYLGGASLETEFGIVAATAQVTTANITTANVSGALNATGGINSTAVSTFTAKTTFSDLNTSDDSLFKLIYSTNVAGITSLTITGLDGNVDKTYYIVLQGTSTSGALTAIALNSDTTDTNYMYGATYISGASVAYTKANSRNIGLTESISSHMVITITAKAGVTRSVLSSGMSSSTANQIDNITTYGVSWENTTDNITSITITFGDTMTLNNFEMYSRR